MDGVFLGKTRKKQAGVSGKHISEIWVEIVYQVMGEDCSPGDAQGAVPLGVVTNTTPTPSACLNKTNAICFFRLRAYFGRQRSKRKGWVRKSIKFSHKGVVMFFAQPGAVQPRDAFKDVAIRSWLPQPG